VRFCHSVALGFLLFGAIDLDRPDPVPWETLLSRLVDAVAVDAITGGVGKRGGGASEPAD
jgi:hypothetical protein